MKDPAFLFYSSDFLSGVCDLTMEERGQFITLLCLQHQKNELSEKTIRLNVGSVSDTVMDKFRLCENGNYINDRLALEITKRANYTESRRENGKKGGRPLKNKHTETINESIAKPYGYDMLNHMGNRNENVNEIKNEIISFEDQRNFSLKKFSLENCISEFELWNQPASEAEKFYDHYNSQGWVKANGQRITSIRSLAAMWIKNPREHIAKKNEVGKGSKTIQAAERALELHNKLKG